jgi:hypothetical protein
MLDSNCPPNHLLGSGQPADNFGQMQYELPPVKRRGAMLARDKEVDLGPRVSPPFSRVSDGPQPYQGRPLVGPVPLRRCGPDAFGWRASLEFAADVGGVRGAPGPGRRSGRGLKPHAYTPAMPAVLRSTAVIPGFQTRRQPRAGRDRADPHTCRVRRRTTRRRDGSDPDDDRVPAGALLRRFLGVDRRRLRRAPDRNVRFGSFGLTQSSGWTLYVRVAAFAARRGAGVPPMLSRCVRPPRSATRRRVLRPGTSSLRPRQRTGHLAGTGGPRRLRHARTPFLAEFRA